MVSASPSRLPMTPSRHTMAGAIAGLLLGSCLVSGARAEPIKPLRDDEVIDVLPGAAGGRREERTARRALAAAPRDPVLAVAMAKRYLDQAHEQGDPRFAGMAMAALAGWTDPVSMPADVLLMKANLQQYLHEFDASVRSLEALLARPGLPPQPQVDQVFLVEAQRFALNKVHLPVND